MSHKELNLPEDPFERGRPRRAPTGPNPTKKGKPPPVVSESEEEIRLRLQEQNISTKVDVTTVRNNAEEFSFIHHMQLFDYFTFVLRQAASKESLTEEEKSIAQSYMAACHATLGGCGCNKDTRVRVAVESYRGLALAEEGTPKRGLMEKVKANLETKSLIFLLDGEEVARF
jgi:hypothetical protein